jgi:hypothetical protein
MDGCDERQRDHKLSPVGKRVLKGTAVAREWINWVHELGGGVFTE